MSDLKCCKYLLLFIGFDKKNIVFYLWINNFYLLYIRLDSCYMMVVVLRLIFVISTTTMNLLVIIHLLGSRHVVLHLII
jgi:hypothetical protein